MRITTWNVNSLRARLPQFLAWLEANQPDAVCLQETKCLDDAFPRLDLAGIGYQAAVHGQRTYNGVAICARSPLLDVETGIPWQGDGQARGIAATVDGMRVISLYVPHGQDVGSEASSYKLAWLGRLAEYLRPVAARGNLVVCGDFNIAPADIDVYDPAAWREKVLCSTPERQAFQALEALGLVDALRRVNPEPGVYTWWDYRQGMFRRNLGLRIDHFLVTPDVADRIQAVEVHTDVRRGEAPSDHAPVSLVLA